MRSLATAPQDVALKSGEVLADMCEVWPRVTPQERQDAARITLDAVGLNLREKRIEALKPKSSFAPLFQAVAEDKGGVVAVCDWRPRARSGSP